MSLELICECSHHLGLHPLPGRCRHERCFCKNLVLDAVKIAENCSIATSNYEDSVKREIIRRLLILRRATRMREKDLFTPKQMDTAINRAWEAAYLDAAEIVKNMPATNMGEYRTPDEMRLLIVEAIRAKAAEVGK